MIKNKEKINAHCTSLDFSKEDNAFIYIIPKNDQDVLLGGVAEFNKSDKEGIDNNLLRRIENDCSKFLLTLDDRTSKEKESYIVGLRPYRTFEVRVEHDQGVLFHNYGHGGSGVLLSWGTAEEIVRLASNL